MRRIRERRPDGSERARLVHAAGSLGDVTRFEYRHSTPRTFITICCSYLHFRSKRPVPVAAALMSVSVRTPSFRVN
jgi:hypothetical protein